MAIDPDQESFYIPGNDGQIELQVGEPIVVKSGLKEHHEYQIIGRDSHGDIDCLRRYSHFFEFREMLQRKFPGLYIPPIPKKTNLSKTNHSDASVVAERVYFFDLFVKECCALKYLAQSKELQIFLRPQGRLTRLMDKQKMPKLLEILSTYRATVPVAEDTRQYDMLKFAEDINRFVAEQKTFIQLFAQFSRSIKRIVPIKDLERQLYQVFSDQMERIED